ncbi:MarR family winged helix-turn-helix transcriptional regulator [Streptomyces sp. AK04-3B]|uniref:MarR family winged helix-turn-helix transcriptional regulator n=1 Tax=Streptomyces sp. AK04-3B TaxID=3028650 RepID=UPI0029B789B7|nr:MarR family transcriptional regulator [Streptomyces sp. AK04-3B]MDX3799171.1 MarR family transcriptional regulator [Streptomyces sp. AK04-3B]
MTEAPATADIEACETLALFSRLLETSVNRALQRQFGVSLEEHAVLSLLHRSGGQVLHVTDVATSLGFSRSRVSRCVNRQCLRGRLSRTPCPRDARAAHVALTEQGTAFVQQLGRAYRAAVRAGLGSLHIGSEDVTELVRRLPPLTERYTRLRPLSACSGRPRPTA